MDWLICPCVPMWTTSLAEFHTNTSTPQKNMIRPASEALPLLAKSQINKPTIATTNGKIAMTMIQSPLNWDNSSRVDVEIHLFSVK